MRAKESVRKSKAQKQKDKTTIDLYDTYWQRGNFMAVKTAKEKVDRQLATVEQKDENKPFSSNPVQRFSLTKSFGAIDFERLVVRKNIKDAMLAGLSPTESEEFESHYGRREGVFKKYLVRFLLISKRQSWQRKYRPISTDQVFNSESTEMLRQWVLTFFERKEEAADKSQFNDTDSDLQFRSSDKKYRIQDHHGHSYRCLLLIGKAGVGKTSAIEALCQENGYHLECIDCTWFNTFNDLKKKYSEAVKSQTVGPSMRKLNEQPTISPLTRFFKMSQTEADKNVADGEQELQKPRKKIFLLNNFDSFFDREQDADQGAIDRLGKQMIEFSDFSSFPFIIETTDKSKTEQCFDSSRFFDHVRYTAADIDYCSWVLHVIVRLESVSRHAADSEMRRFHENELIEKSSDWQSIAQQSIDQFDARIGMADVAGCAWLISLRQLDGFIRSYSFDLHRIIANLSFQMNYSPSADLKPRLSLPLRAEQTDEREAGDIKRYLKRVIKPGLVDGQPSARDVEDAEFVKELRKQHIRSVDPDLLTLFRLLSTASPIDTTSPRPASQRNNPTGGLPYPPQ